MEVLIGPLRVHLTLRASGADADFGEDVQAAW